MPYGRAPAFDRLFDGKSWITPQRWPGTPLPERPSRPRVVIRCDDQISKVRARCQRLGHADEGRPPQLLHGLIYRTGGSSCRLSDPSAISRNCRFTTGSKARSALARRGALPNDTGARSSATLRWVAAAIGVIVTHGRINSLGDYSGGERLSRLSGAESGSTAVRQLYVRMPTRAHMLKAKTTH